jgi:hypothetical protein
MDGGREFVSVFAVLSERVLMFMVGVWVGLGTKMSQAQDGLGSLESRGDGYH